MIAISQFSTDVYYIILDSLRDTKNNNKQIVYDRGSNSMNVRPTIRNICGAHVKIKLSDSKRLTRNIFEVEGIKIEN